MNKPIKFYWNECYPEVLYCIGFNGNVYILRDFLSGNVPVNPETGKVEYKKFWYDTWRLSSINPNELRSGYKSKWHDGQFEYIGEL